MEFLKYILSISGSTVLILALIGFLFRSIISQILSKDIENFKNKLQSEADIKLAHTRYDLKCIAIEHEVRFSTLHQKRAEIIAELYGLLSKASAQVKSFVSPMEWTGEPDKNEKYSIAMQSLKDLFSYFDQNRIYLPEYLCNSIDNFIEGLRVPTIKFSFYLGASNYDEEALRKRKEAWIEAWEKVESNVPAARKALEKEFRSILGVDDEPA